VNVFQIGEVHDCKHTLFHFCHHLSRHTFDAGRPSWNTTDSLHALFVLPTSFVSLSDHNGGKKARVVLGDGRN
jgi:hypothetical protein